MGKTIQVDPAQLDTTASRIESLAADYKVQYDQLYSETSAMASAWSGKDNIAYINQIEGFKDDFAKMYSLMLDYAKFLKSSAEIYRDTQNTAVSNANKLAN